jgi:hypothetical protein
MDYSRICKDILDFDPKVRFAGICDESGETKYGGMREGLPSILSPEDTQKSNRLAIGRWGLRYALEHKTGKGKYSMTEYEKMKRATIPLNDEYLLLISMEVQADHSSIIESILNIIKH